MAKRVLDVAVYCTPERVKKGREIVIEPRETASAGNVVMTGQRELQSTALDVLYRNGYLGKGEPARWRFNAGFWLRELYLKTHPSDGVSGYSPLIMRDSGEISDEMAWNFRCLNDTIKALGKYWRVLEQVCCEDTALGNPAPVVLALDFLRDLRDGYLEDYLASFEK